MSSDLRDAALFYRRRGWSPIPISPVTKKALVEWGEYQERIATEQEIEQWWRKFPNAGVGIVTGKISNLVVLDVDTKKGADANYVYNTYPTPLVVRTGSGGGHFYYEYPEGAEQIPNVVGKVNGKPSGYDLRADGGYVVAPPSLHPSGRRYEWLQTGKVAAKVTPKLLEFILPKKADTNGSLTSHEPWLTDALQGVGEGARDDTCARLAGYWFSKGMAADVVLEQLRMWNERNTPPLPEADLQKTVTSIQKTRARRPSGAVTTQARDLEDNEQDLLRLMSLHQYMSTYGDSDIRWLIEDWLPAATIAMLVSPPGTYKTWTLIDLALSVATGTPFLGTAKVQQQGAVLIYQQEDFHGQMAQRIGTIISGRYDLGEHPTSNGKTFSVTLPPSPPIYLHDNRELRFDNEEVMDVLEARIAELKPAVVIVDPLYTAADMTDYMAKAVPHMMRLKTLRDRYGCSFILAHHTSKKSEKSNREDAWGSQFLNAFLETGWQVRPKAEGQALIRRHFKVTSDMPEMVLTFDIHTKSLPYRYRTSLSTVEDAESKDISIISALDKHGPMKAADIAKLLKVDRSTVTRHMRPLLSSGAVRLDENNFYRSPEFFDVNEN